MTEPQKCRRLKIDDDSKSQNVVVTVSGNSRFFKVGHPFFSFFKNIDFSGGLGVKGQKIAQNEK